MQELLSLDVTTKDGLTILYDHLTKTFDRYARHQCFRMRMEADDLAGTMWLNVLEHLAQPDPLLPSGTRLLEQTENFIAQWAVWECAAITYRARRAQDNELAWSDGFDPAAELDLDSTMDCEQRWVDDLRIAAYPDALDTRPALLRRAERLSNGFWDVTTLAKAIDALAASVAQRSHNPKNGRAFVTAAYLLLACGSMKKARAMGAGSASVKRAFDLLRGGPEFVF